jgi:enediyne polyketide synthase
MFFSSLVRRLAWSGLAVTEFDDPNVHFSTGEGQKSHYTDKRLLQDCELFLLSGDTIPDLLQQIEQLLLLKAPDSKSDFIALAQQLAQTNQRGHIRSAVVASQVTELIQRLHTLKDLLHKGTTRHIDMQEGIFLGSSAIPPRIGFLFTGQGAPPYRNGGLIRQRFRFIDDLYLQAQLPAEGDENETAIAQPAIIISSVAAINLLEKLGISANVGLGHSLGELIAQYWAGIMDHMTLLNMTQIRSQAMSMGAPTGAMLTLGTSQEQAETLLAGKEAFIAGIVAPQLTVIAGDAADVAKVLDQAQAKNIRAMQMPLAYAFHTPCIQASIPPLAHYLASIQFQMPTRTMISTVTGKKLAAKTDLAALLCQQIISPVQFMDAVQCAAQEVDLFIEVGPGNLISNFTAQCTSVPVFSVDAGGTSMKQLLQIIGLVFTSGMPIHSEFLFADI